ncbi:hypothetical protein KJ660_03540 [Candidatus Micrarchaeota archaeon]|nr:hypothetical protein [Candidatus Micrarchaeota archaeon]
MTPKRSDIIVLCIAILLFNIILINNCPYHVDYIQYAKSIDNFYSNRIIDDNVNGKYIYVFIMGILVMPFHMQGINTFMAMIVITGLFQAILIWLFYRLTNSILKTYLMATTLTFLMFISQPETVMLSSIFMLLFFINRDKPYSEFFIMFASLIRIDFAVYYLFTRKKTAVLPMLFTFLLWLTGRYFLHSDFGINRHIFTAMLVFLLSYGAYFILFLGDARPREKNFDWIIHLAIVMFFMFFLKFPSQKIFFFPVMLSFIIYDFKNTDRFKWIIIAFAMINVIMASIMLYQRESLCTAEALYEYGLKHNESIYFGVLQPYLDYYGLKEEPPFKYKITKLCDDSVDYVIVEDWRNGQLFFLSYKFCLEPFE